MLGKFIVVEGIDFSGKTTFVEQLTRILNNANLPTEYTSLPGGFTEECKQLRSIIVNNHHDKHTKDILFSANISILSKSIIEKTTVGVNVLCTRWVPSGMTYRPAQALFRNFVHRHITVADPSIYVLLTVTDDTFKKAMISKNEQDLLGEENIVDIAKKRKSFKKAVNAQKNSIIFEIEYNKGNGKIPTDDEFINMYPELMKCLGYVTNVGEDHA